MEAEIKSIMANVLEVPLDAITEEASLHTIPSWDSLKHMELMVAFEKAFRIRLDDDEIPTMISFPVIVATIESHLE